MIEEKELAKLKRVKHENEINHLEEYIESLEGLSEAVRHEVEDLRNIEVKQKDSTKLEAIIDNLEDLSGRIYSLYEDLKWEYQDLSVVEENRRLKEIVKEKLSPSELFKLSKEMDI